MSNRGVESLERAFRLLECFDGADEPLSLAELSRRSGFYKSTILRLIHSMERFGYLVRDADGGYRLGPTLWRLGSRYRQRFDLASLIRPALKDLVDRTGETASYYVREGNSRICLYRHNSPQAIHHHLVEGSRLDLRWGATGRILRAYSELATPEDTELRTLGYAVSLGERDPDIAAVAVAVLDSHGQCRGALAVSGLISRFAQAERGLALGALQGVAGELCKALLPQQAEVKT